MKRRETTCGRSCLTAPTVRTRGPHGLTCGNKVNLQVAPCVTYRAPVHRGSVERRTYLRYPKVLLLTSFVKNLEIPKATPIHRHHRRASTAPAWASTPPASRGARIAEPDSSRLEVVTVTELVRHVFGIEVKATHDPEGRSAVLLQLPHGFVVMNTTDALKIAAALVDVVDALDGLPHEP